MLKRRIPFGIEDYKEIIEYEYKEQGEYLYEPFPFVFAMSMGKTQK